MGGGRRVGRPARCARVQIHLGVLTGRSAPTRPHHLDVDPLNPGHAEPTGLTDDPERDADGPDRATELIASGAGRRRLARELDITEHAARELLAERRDRPEVTQ